MSRDRTGAESAPLPPPKPLSRKNVGAERHRLVALVQGGIAGAVYGTFQGLEDRSLLSGVLWGLFFGLVMTAAFYSAWRAGEHFVGLTYREKRAVLRAVRRGEPVGDPALAGAVIRQAQRVQASAGSQRLGVALAQGFLAMSALGLAWRWRSATPSVLALPVSRCWCGSSSFSWGHRSTTQSGERTGSGGGRKPRRSFGGLTRGIRSSWCCSASG